MAANESDESKQNKSKISGHFETSIHSRLFIPLPGIPHCGLLVSAVVCARTAVVGEYAEKADKMGSHLGTRIVASSICTLCRILLCFSPEEQRLNLQWYRIVPIFNCSVSLSWWNSISSHPPQGLTYE